MPHWNIPTEMTDVNHGGTFWQYACEAGTGTGTEVRKKVTCAPCKALIEQPLTPRVAAARLIRDVQDAMEKSDFSGDDYVMVRCNGCDRELETFDALFENGHTLVRQAIVFLEHVAYEHMGGCHVMFAVVRSNYSAYQLNAAMRKPAMTNQEQDWRDRHEIPV